jgi:hypothetical protein
MKYIMLVSFLGCLVVSAYLATDQYKYSPEAWDHAAIFVLLLTILFNQDGGRDDS